MKKLFLLALLLLNSFWLTGCSNDHSDNHFTHLGDPNQMIVRIGVSLYDFNDDFTLLYKEALMEHFQYLNTEFIRYDLTIVDAQADQARQTIQIDRFINRNYNIIITSLVQPSAATSIIEKCRVIGIPVIFVSREIDPYAVDLWPGHQTFIGTNIADVAKVQAMIINDLPNDGDINNDGIIGYIMLIGDLDKIETQELLRNSLSELLDSNKAVNRYSVVQAFDNRARARELLIDILYENDYLDIIVATSAPMILGAKDAVEMLGLVVGEDIYVVGFGGNEEVFNAINQGRITGIVFNDHNQQAQTTVEVALLLLRGEEVESSYIIELVKVR